MAVHPERLNIISLCTGGGGLDLGLELAMPGAHTVCVVERECFAVAHLVAAMQQGLLAECPLWSDVRTFDGRPWRGLVDGITGGIPCQPHSLAGKRLGEDDERDLWSAARRIIVHARPWFVLIENVGGMLTSGGAERVVRDLRRLGFAVEVGLFSASEIGASHQRERVFILAVADGAGMGFGRRPGPQPIQSGRGGRSDAENFGGSLARDQQLADAGRGDQQRWRGTGDLPSTAGTGEGEGRQRQRHGNAAGDGCEDLGRGGYLADADDCQSPLDLCLGGNPRQECASSAGICRDVGDASFRNGAGSGQHEAHHPEARQWQSGRSDVGLFPPGPADLEGWRRTLSHSPDLEPSICKLANGLASGVDNTRIEELRLLGNGVVPLQAAYAIRTLCARLAATGSAGAARLVHMSRSSQ